MIVRYVGPAARGVTGGVAWTRNQPVDLPDAVAVALLAGGVEEGTNRVVAPIWEPVDPAGIEAREEEE